MALVDRHRNGVEAVARGLLGSDEVAGVRKPLTEAVPLPPRIYVDPDVFAAEQEHIFRREWLPAGVVDQVRAPGDYFTVDIAGQPLVVLRNDAGVINTFYRVCRHRSALIIEGNGNAKSFQCPYHCWTYDLNGQLVSAPDMHKTTAFRKEDIRLVVVRTEIWHGIIMVNFDPDAAPLGPRLDALSERVGPWDIAGLEVGVERRFDCAFDWKLMYENAVEPYHVQGTHYESSEHVMPSAGCWVELEHDGEPYSVYHHPFATPVAPDAGAGGPRATEAGASLPGLPDSVREEIVFISVWPCLVLSLSHIGIISYIVQPQGPGSCTFTWRAHSHPSAKDQPGFKEAMRLTADRIELVQSEDEGVCPDVARGLASWGSKPSCFSHLEGCIWHFQRWYADRMEKGG
jgi:Rieske 2Fe-2S family protein